MLDRAQHQRVIVMARLLACGQRSWLSVRSIEGQATARCYRPPVDLESIDLIFSPESVRTKTSVSSLSDVIRGRPAA